MRVTIGVSLPEEVRALLARGVRAGRYGGVSDYVRALIVEERRRSGDRLVERVKPVKMGRPKKAA
jgi:Arc/MetJ-type ribon-helix-helix transcriptional regulator